MRIVDLRDQYVDSYCVCLEGWSSEMQEAGDHKARWFEKMRDRGLRVKLALDDDGRPIGMIQYVPIEQSPAHGVDLYMILCIWVHGHKEGVGNQQGRGTGTALLSAAEEDAARVGAKGMAAWGLTMPVWMKASWFKKHGYRRVDRSGSRALLWKPFTSDAVAPRWIEEASVPAPEPGQVTVTGYVNGWCPAANLTYERAKRAAAELGDRVVFRSIDTSERAVLLEHGHLDGVFVDGKTVQRGSPPSYDRIRKRIERRLRKLTRRN